MPRVVPFAIFVAFLAAQPLLESHLDSRWVVVARGIAVAAALAWFWRRYAADFGRPRAAASDWAIVVVVGLAVFGAWITLDGGWTAFA
ncbi:MAG TPA: CPBP family intramembrane glutamate endopeptidase, partial [Burkholderiales bacterium]|nr:CPBP family intramembrane glutamate endopeptidase [Burkholderiales bacterium]